MSLQHLDTILSKASSAGLSRQGLHILVILASAQGEAAFRSHRTLAELTSESVPSTIATLNHLRSLFYVELTRSRIREMTIWVELTAPGRGFIKSLNLSPEN